MKNQDLIKLNKVRKKYCFRRCKILFRVLLLIENLCKKRLGFVNIWILNDIGVEVLLKCTDDIFYLFKQVVRARSLKKVIETIIVKLCVLEKILVTKISGICIELTYVLDLNFFKKLSAYKSIFADYFFQNQPISTEKLPTWYWFISWYSRKKTTGPANAELIHILGK